ncbi:MAG: tRNA(Ile2) 2-agmatinylcytidine synthetase [Methanoculleus sp. SDB]|nr:MAG: tRNA(Ile2) 2-agmatinylcytidine synthetase [Methanoculleus sp. SDB]
MLIGIDDTDSPSGMCTTYIGALLVRCLGEAGCTVREARLIRLNPNVPYKTRGNAAVCIVAEGDAERAFQIACGLVDTYADLACNGTNPGVVVVSEPPDSAFYYRALREFCGIDEAVRLCEAAGARFRGWKNRRGLIGAFAAVASDLPDMTWEFLAYRDAAVTGVRDVDPASIFAADEATYPHTWDSVDRENGVVVCVPHTPDPVLFGIRGESPAWVSLAAGMIRSEPSVLTQIYRTNQGTDAHIIPGRAGALAEGCSYRLQGTVAAPPVTRRGGHISLILDDAGVPVRCMAYEPTKGFRDRVRSLIPGDRICVQGSWKGGSINLEKIRIDALAPKTIIRPPLCPAGHGRMTSAGAGKGYKCRRCSLRSPYPDVTDLPRALAPGWYEVPPMARRHLALPLVRKRLLHN